MTEGQVNIKLGVAFDLNGEAITLEPKEAISEIKKKGIDLSLPRKVELGQVGDGIDSILNTLGSDQTVDGIKDQLPDFEPLTKFYDKVTEAILSVEKFHAKIPGSNYLEKKKKTDNSYKLSSKDYKFTVGLSATWSVEEGETGLTLTGIYFEASNEQPIPVATKAAEATQ